LNIQIGKPIHLFVRAFGTDMDKPLIFEWAVSVATKMQMLDQLIF